MSDAKDREATPDKRCLERRDRIVKRKPAKKNDTEKAENILEKFKDFDFVCRMCGFK